MTSSGQSVLTSRDCPLTPGHCPPLLLTPLSQSDTSALWETENVQKDFSLEVKISGLWKILGLYALVERDFDINNTSLAHLSFRKATRAIRKTRKGL